MSPDEVVEAEAVPAGQEDGTPEAPNVSLQANIMANPEVTAIAAIASKTTPEHLNKVLDNARVDAKENRAHVKYIVTLFVVAILLAHLCAAVPWAHRTAAPVADRWSRVCGRSWFRYVKVFP